MVSGGRMQVTLKGGAPWGFRLAGGGSMPLTINKIRKKSAAHTSGVREGDAVIAINGIHVHDKSQDEALELVEHSGDTLTLEIFRGDMDDLSRSKPKKTITIGGGRGGGESAEGGFVLTATVGDVSSSSNDPPPQVETEMSSDIILTASVASDSYETAESEIAGGGFTATIGDVTESSIDNTDSGFTITASAEDVTSSSIMVDSISAEIGDFDNSDIVLVPETELQAAATVSPNLAQPFTDSSVIAVSPSHLSPQPPRSSLSPKPVAFSPKPISPLSPSPKSPLPHVISPNSPSFIATSPKPVSFSPRPDTKVQNLSPMPFQPSPTSNSPKPISLSPRPETMIQNTSPKPFQPAPPSTSPKPLSFSPRPETMVQNASPKPFQPAPPPSPKPSAISSHVATSIETFDDGRGQIHREMKVSAQKETNTGSPGAAIFKRETTTTTSHTKKGPAFMQHTSSAFEPPNQTQKRLNSSTTVASNNSNINNFNRKGPVPFSASMNQLDSNIINSSPALIPSQAAGQPMMPGPSPVFKPSKFVLGQGKKDIAGLYPPGPQPAEVTPNAMNKDGKENVQPMFQVKNIVGDKGRRGRDVWKPNVWLPGQQGQQVKKAPKSPSVADDFSPYSSFPVPHVEPGVSLMEPRKKDRAKQYTELHNCDYDDYDDQPDNQAKRPHKLHIFAPPVEIHAPDDSGYPDSPYSPFLPYREDGEIDTGYHMEEGPSSPDSSTLRRKNLYADSAFYDTPGKSYPTITEQMKLCKIIATSLTSQANRRARGAKMFMRRKRKSNKWIHDGHSEWSSSAGDVANIQDLDSELSVDEGGTKPLFYFKIPNLKNRISSADRKMALTQEQFERLRLQSNKCDHKAVPPTTCFDIVADLKASKGRGGRMFEKRKVRVEKYVVDEKNARHPAPRKKLENALNKPIRQEKTPWEAAMEHGNVDAAFSHIDEMERNRKLNQILKYPPAKKAPSAAQQMPVAPKVAVPMFQTSLKADPVMRAKGKDFNRTARGWGGGGEYPVAEKLLTISAPTRKSTAVSAPSTPMMHSPHYGDYNPKIKAWQTPGASPYVTSSSSNAQMPQYATLPRRQEPKMQQSWHSGVQQQQPVESSDRWRSQDDLRPKPRAPETYETNIYKDEYDYTYVPVDYKFADDYSSPAYKQPIIPGTDL